MGPAMDADPKHDPDAGAMRQAVRGLRGRVAAVERALALGILTVVVWSFVQFSVAVKLYPLIFGSHPPGDGVGGQILDALASQASLLVVLPALAWILGLLVEGSPLAVGMGAAAVVEVFVLAVQYLSTGSRLLLDQPAYLGTLLLLGLAAGVAASFSFRHGRRWIDARERARRRVAPPGDAPPGDPPPAPSGDAPGADGSGSGSSR